jgi:hypothetical protein
VFTCQTATALFVWVRVYNGDQIKVDHVQKNGIMFTFEAEPLLKAFFSVPFEAGDEREKEVFATAISKLKSTRKFKVPSEDDLITTQNGSKTWFKQASDDIGTRKGLICRVLFARTDVMAESRAEWEDFEDISIDWE